MPSHLIARLRPYAARVVSVLGIGVGLVGLVLIGRIIIRDWDEIADAVGGARPLLLVAAVLVGLLAMSLIGINWLSLIGRSDERVAPADGLTWYFVGQLGKYVPGGVWPVVGRAELATRGGVTRRNAYAMTAFSMFATYGCAGAIAVALLPLALGAPVVISVGAPLLVVGVILASVRPAITGRVLGVGAKLTGGRLSYNTPSARFSLAVLAAHLPVWLAIAGATWLVARSLGYSADIVLFAAAVPAAWLAGFVIIGLPGGLGVREAVFVALASTQMTEVEAAAVALLARVVFMAVDLLGPALASGIAARQRVTARRGALE